MQPEALRSNILPAVTAILHRTRRRREYASAYVLVLMQSSVLLQTQVVTHTFLGRVSAYKTKAPALGTEIQEPADLPITNTIRD